jgi:hypothetical protein
MAFTSSITLGYSRIYKDDPSGHAVLATAGMSVDADGSPRCYAPACSKLKGLDYLANAGSPGNWWGIATDDAGKPYVQCECHTAPGYYVSTTSLVDRTKLESDPDRYVDSETVPFIAIPSRPKFGIVVGDLAMVLRPETGDSSEAIVADVGPRNRFGEGSIKLAENLNIDPSPKSGGVAHGIVYVMFPGSKVKWRKGLDFLEGSNNRFLKFGGFRKLRDELPEIEWDNF